MDNRRWGNLELVEEFKPELMRKRLNGTEYKTGELGQLTWRLKCDCGHFFEIEQQKFPGRRVMRTCQRPECPLEPARSAPAAATAAAGHYIPTPINPSGARLGRPPSGRPLSAQFTIHMQVQLIQAIDAIAIQRNISRNNTIVQILEAHIAALEG